MRYCGCGFPFPSLHSLVLLQVVLQVLRFLALSAPTLAGAVISSGAVEKATCLLPLFPQLRLSVLHLLCDCLGQLGANYKPQLSPYSGMGGSSKAEDAAIRMWIQPITLAREAERCAVR